MTFKSDGEDAAGTPSDGGNAAGKPSDGEDAVFAVARERTPPAYFNIALVFSMSKAI